MTDASDIETRVDEERAEIEEGIALLADERVREILRRMVTWVHERTHHASTRLHHELSDLEARVDRLERDWERDDEKIV